MAEQWDGNLDMNDEDIVAIVSIMGTTGGQSPIVASILQLLRVR